MAGKTGPVADMGLAVAGDTWLVETGFGMWQTTHGLSRQGMACSKGRPPCGMQCLGPRSSWLVPNLGLPGADEIWPVAEHFCKVGRFRHVAGGKEARACFFCRRMNALSFSLSLSLSLSLHVYIYICANKYMVCTSTDMCTEMNSFLRMVCNICVENPFGAQNPEQAWWTFQSHKTTRPDRNCIQIGTKQMQSCVEKQCGPLLVLAQHPGWSKMMQKSGAQRL